MTRVPALAALLLAAAARADVPPADWIEHVDRDLGTLWMRDDLAGHPPGSFPTFLCADGKPYDAAAPCPAFEEAPEWIRKELGRQNVRMISRQVFTYGVIYHLTGNTAALERARAGTRFILERAWDRKTGSVATFFERGKPGPRPGQRTSQSLAYSALGPAFYHYLTRDPEALAFVQAVRRHILDRYWSDEWKMLRWTLQDFGDDTTDRKELVAQLDQVNAYLLLLLPLLQGEERAAWEADLRRLVGVLLRDFHDPQRKRFFGYVHDEKGRLWGERHNDFGHTTKAYWMLLLAGRKLGEAEWVATAKAGLEDVLASAFVRRDVSTAPPWQASVVRGAADADGKYAVWSNEPGGIGIPWWEWCELDQAAATLSLDDARHASTLDETYRSFFATLVDPVHGGIHVFPGAVDAPKATHWQNGYHAAEHALVGYVTSALRRGEPFRLYFAFPDAARGAAAPAHLFDAREVDRRGLERLAGGLRRVRVGYASR